jgi:hypothetical protein
LIPSFDGATLSREWKDALYPENGRMRYGIDNFTAAPRGPGVPSS